MSLNVILWPGAANPNDVILHDPNGSTQIISPSGIASAEAFGTATILIGAVTIQVTGIASAEVFGTPTITVGGVTIQVSGIASAEAFGTATIVAGAVIISVTGIPSDEAFGTPDITQTAPIVVIISPLGIPSEEAFGTPRIGVGPRPAMVTVIVPDCRQRTCDLVSDLGSYTLDSATTPRVVESEDCRARECVLTPDIEIYTLEDRLAFNGTPLSFVVQCPTGYYCAPGTFPKTFTYPPGTFTIPLPPINTGFPIIVQLQGCSSNVSIVLPATATQAQVDAAGQQVINQVAAQQAQCDAIKSAGPLLPISIQLSDIFTYACSGVPMALAIHGSSTPSRLPITFIVSNQPSFLTASQSPSTLFMAGTPSTIGVYNFGVTATAPGTPPGSGSKSYTLNVIGIATASPLPNGNVGSPYSQVLDGSSIPGSLTWSVSVGVLPDGLSLDASTGEIAGTPTTDVIDTFTVLATNGEIGCEKEFDLEIVDVSDCSSLFSTLVWDPPLYLDQGPGTSLGIVALNQFNLTGSQPGGFAGNSQGAVQCTGNLTYTGAGISCCVTGNFFGTDSGPFLPGLFNTNYQIYVYQDFVLIASEAISGTSVSVPVSMPFTIAPGAGSIITVIVAAVAFANGADKPASNVSFVGQIGGC